MFFPMSRTHSLSCSRADALLAHSTSSSSGNGLILLYFFHIKGVQYLKSIFILFLIKTCLCQTEILKDLILFAVYLTNKEQFSRA